MMFFVGELELVFFMIEDFCDYWVMQIVFLGILLFMFILSWNMFFIVLCLGQF